MTACVCGSKNRTMTTENSRGIFSVFEKKKSEKLKKKKKREKENRNKLQDVDRYNCILYLAYIVSYSSSMIYVTELSFPFRSIRLLIKLYNL